MLQRTNRLNADQENPGLARLTGASNLGKQPQVPYKTPSKQQQQYPLSTYKYASGLAKSNASLHGGKGSSIAKGGGLTAKRTKVLGAKDANMGRGTTKEISSLSLPSKSKGGVTCIPLTSKTPPATRKLPSHLRTPDPGLAKIALSLLSPESETREEVEQATEKEEEEEDREVEYAGQSARNYDEPFQPDIPEVSFKGIGTYLRNAPLFTQEDDEEWLQRDARERRAFKAEMVEESHLASPFNENQTSTLLPLPDSIQSKLKRDTAVPQVVSRSTARISSRVPNTASTSVPRQSQRSFWSSPHLRGSNSVLTKPSLPLIRSSPRARTHVDVVPNRTGAMSGLKATSLKSSAMPLEAKAPLRNVGLSRVKSAVGPGMLDKGLNQTNSSSTKRNTHSTASAFIDGPTNSYLSPTKRRSSIPSRHRTTVPDYSAAPYQSLIGSREEEERLGIFGIVEMESAVQVFEDGMARLRLDVDDEDGCFAFTL